MNDSLGDYLRFISGSTTLQDDKSETKSKREDVALMLKKKKECESRSMKILEFLIEGKIQPEVFLRCVNFLNRSYYEDIVEERSITNLCGYCMCDNDSSIPKMSKKQFSIDSKSNKIYNITNRKKYCSDYCYKASVHIQKQIDDSPLWLRNAKDLPKYTLLQPTDPGSPGEDLSSDFHIVQKNDIPFESAFSFAEVSLKEIGEMNDNGHKSKSQSKNISTETQLPERPINDDKLVSASISNNIPTTTSERKNEKPQISATKKIIKQSKTNRKNKIEVLKEYVLGWLTLDTYIFLFGEECLREHINRLDLAPSADNSVIQQREITQLSRKLALSECVDNRHDRLFLNKQLKPILSYKQLKKDNKNINIKVRSFYSGDTFDVSDSNTGARESHDENPTGTETTALDILPVTESPNVIRQNVFLNSVKTTMKTVTEHLGMPWLNVLKKLELLVKTLVFQPHTVVFQPVEWNLISLILIRLLSLHDTSIKGQLHTQKSQAFINATVSAFPGIQTMFAELFQNIEDIDKFIHSYYASQNNCGGET